MEFQKYDDIVNEWKQEVFKNRGKNTALVLASCEKIKQYAVERNERSLLGFAYYYSAEAYYLFNDIEHMFQNIARAIYLLDETKQWELAARSYNLMAIISINKGNAAAAMEYCLIGISCCKKYGLEKMESILNVNLGNLYLQSGVCHEAQQYFERAYSFYKNTSLENSNIGTLTVIYANLARCYLLRGILEKTKEYIDKIDVQCAPYYDEIDALYVGCIKARYYHQIQDYEKREELIVQIQDIVQKEIAIMDVFEDLYDFCGLMFELKRIDCLWQMIKRLETVVKAACITNLQRKLTALKIKIYRWRKDEQAFLKETAVYYELTEIMEQENKNMVSNMLCVRSSLERANESRRKVEEANRKLLKKSQTDALTGLANRYKLNEYSKKIIAYCSKKQLPLAVEMLDIDYFKEYNDNYGHQAGDDCIAAIAGELKKMECDTVFCARYGGDEFMILYIGMEALEVYEKAKDLRRRILQLQREHLYSKAVPVVTVSQGICFGVPQEHKSWDFLHKADNMLYHVKKRNRNDICMGNLFEQELEIPSLQAAEKKHEPKKEMCIQ